MSGISRVRKKSGSRPTSCARTLRIWDTPWRIPRKKLPYFKNDSRFQSSFLGHDKIDETPGYNDSSGDFLSGEPRGHSRERRVLNRLFIRIGRHLHIPSGFTVYLNDDGNVLI